MAALASLLVKMGKRVSGSDEAEGLGTVRLRTLGATIRVGHRSENVGSADLVVRSAAVPDDNPEVMAAQRQGIPHVKLAEAVGRLMASRGGVGVAGTHGKTTTTALVAWLLDQGGEDPLALIGGEAVNFGDSARLGEGPMVVEADEYDRRFLHLSPTVAVVTSVEADHLDYFRDLAEIERTFQAFVDKVPVEGRLVVCADDPGAAALRTVADRVTYGFNSSADWRIDAYQPRPGGGSSFDVHAGGRTWHVESALTGKHNACNAVAAVIVADHFGVGLRAAFSALETFRGTRRRFETRGEVGGVRIVDDYAHHPTKIRATLAAARDCQPGGEIWAVFQPHTSNRTAALLEEFARSFSDAHHALVLPIFRPRGREAAARPVTSEELVARIQATGHPDARFVASFDEAEASLRDAVHSGDLVLTIGAGDVTRLADRLIATLGPTP